MRPLKRGIHDRHRHESYFLSSDSGDNTDSVVKLFEKEPEWIALRLRLDEFLNVLAISERRGKISSDVEDNTLLFFSVGGLKRFRGNIQF